jgi:hypothetical protein
MREATIEPRIRRCTDEVLLEIWRIKDELSAARGHSVEKPFAEARERQEKSGHRVVNLSAARKSTTGDHEQTN